MLSDQEYKTRRRAAVKRLREGDLAGSIEMQTELAEQLMAAGPQSVQTQPGLAGQLERTGGELADLLRWDGQYSAAIALQERLVDFLPDLSSALRLGAANLRIESGEVETGLAQLEVLAAEEVDSFWIQVSLGMAYMYIERYDQAEAVLRQAVEMAHVRKVDRAMAHQYLFGLYDVQGQTSKALAAWREAGRLDRSLRTAMLPAVCRMLIYWHQFSEASNHIGLESNPVRRAFYRGLLLKALLQKKEALEVWREMVVGHNPAELEIGQDEYAEACVRLGIPANAIGALNPLVEAGQTVSFRMVILGLACAQLRDLDRAAWYLDSALRLAEMDRPRRTFAAPQGRILDIHARLLYAEIALEAGVRQSLDRFFVSEGETPVILNS